MHAAFDQLSYTDMSPSFSHASPAFRVHCGADSLSHLPTELDRLGCRRAVIFCGRTLLQAPELQLVLRALDERHVGTFAGVQSHSPLPAIIDGAEALRDMRADAVIAVGGGSAVVSARASSILLAEGMDIHVLCTQYPAGKPPVSPKLLRPKLPQLVVATTPSTAYAKAGTAVLDPVAKRRLTLFDPKTRALAVFMHPALALTAPAELVLDAGLQAFASAVQGLESSSRDPLADALLMHALRLLVRHLPAIVQGRARDRDGQIREQLMLAAFLSGRGTDYAPSGMAAALSHSIGVRFDAPNGITGALLLPHTLRFNAPVTGDRLGLIADALGAAITTPNETTDEAAIAAVTHLLTGLGIPLRLRDVPIDEHALKQIADDTFGDWFLHLNPRRAANAAEVLALLEAAW